MTTTAKAIQVQLKPLATTPLYTQIGRYLRENHEIEYYSSYDDIERRPEEGKTIYKPLNIHFIEASERAEKKAKLNAKINERQEKYDKAHKYDHITHPFLDFNNSERWKSAFKYLHSDRANNVVEMCEESYWHFLECVPPKRMKSGAYICGEPYTHNNKGQAIYLCGIQLKDRYFAQYGTIEQFEKRELFINLQIQ